MESIKHAKLKVPMVEMDRDFIGNFPMSVYLEAARISGRVTEDSNHLVAAEIRLGLA